MNVGGILKNVGMTLGGVLLMVALLGIGAIFVVGATAASLWVIKWVPVVVSSSLLVVCFVLGPLSLIPPARGIAATGFVITSFVFGAVMWFSSLAVTYDLWGTMGVIIGLLIAGVGIVPVAMLATLFHGEWEGLIEFVILIVLTFGLRLLGLWLAKKVDERAARLAFQK